MTNLKSMKGFALTLLLSIFASYGIAQNQFENYAPLKAKGKMPDVFMQSTESKIEDALEEDRSTMTDKQELTYLEHIHYNVDELLHSGLVLYGDPTTKYVQKVATKLLDGEPKLKRQLEFYVIKSNVTNALSTDQGIIFVTLGLLAQVENEAQLAYVISHEIAHFQENHVEESYEERINIDVRSSYDSRITMLSNHSKDNELEADKLGIKLYHEAGYAKSELLSAFDVLMYSYLPFDEVPLPKTYFNTEHLFVPDMYFPEEINPILAEEDYDDDKSSHPNIRKRKDAIIDEVGSYSDWGKAEFILDQNEFENVREIARFEGVRQDLVNCNYADALYSIFLLERKYPDNLYLTRCKSQAWLGLAAFKTNGSFSKAVMKPTKVEGESHAMHYFLRKLSKLQLITVAMREVKDAVRTFPEDKEIKAIYSEMIAVLAGYSRFKLTDYRKINYETALERFERSKEALATDTVVQDTVVVEENEEGLSKYDKIKKKKNVEEAVSEDEEFDVEKFHIYALADLIGDDEFKRIYRVKQDEIKEEEEREEALSRLTYRERQRAERDDPNASVEEIVLIEPAFYSFYYSEDRPKESARVTNLITEDIKKFSEKFGIYVHDVTLNELEKENTNKYNERVLLMNYLRQRVEYEEAKMFPVDFSYLEDVMVNFNEAKMLFAIGSHTKTKVTSRASLSFILIDFETGELKELDTARFRKPKKLILEGYVYDVLSKLKPGK